MNKETFQKFCKKRKKRCIKRCRLSYTSQILMYIQRFRKAKPYYDLSVDFCLGYQSCFNVIENLTFNEVKNANNIPFFIHTENLNDAVDKTLEQLSKECPPLMKNLAKEFVDPLKKNRQMVFACIDATYLYFSRSSNPMLQKITYCKYKAGI